MSTAVSRRKDATGKATNENGSGLTYAVVSTNGPDGKRVKDAALGMRLKLRDSKLDVAVLDGKVVKTFPAIPRATWDGIVQAIVVDTIARSRASIAAGNGPVRFETVLNERLNAPDGFVVTEPNSAEQRFLDAMQAEIDAALARKETSGKPSA